MQVEAIQTKHILRQAHLKGIDRGKKDAEHIFRTGDYILENSAHKNDLRVRRISFKILVRLPGQMEVESISFGLVHLSSWAGVRQYRKLTKITVGLETQQNPL